MTNHINTFDFGEIYEVSLEATHEKVLKIGEKINQKYEDAYMNGYNWEALVLAYLKLNYPDLLKDYSTDSEAGTFTIRFEGEDAGKSGEKLKDILKDLVENEQKIFEFIEENQEDIIWD